ncbi:MAG TPA: hypothetical protein VEB66_07270 [Opitutaceae bacterium]|nr:hypothetical protein [Opitutaceae bacterium]
MGFFDRFSGKKPEPPAPASAPAPTPEKPAVSGGVMPRLAEARAKLDARDLPGAMAIYEEVMAAAGDRADVLVTVSGDLGVRGHMAPIIELVAPRYDAHRHGPATGLNLLQAYLAARHAEAAQHLLDILFSLQRPEIEERLFGFSNALAELMAGHDQAEAVRTPEGGTKINLTTISKPIWFYGLEEAAARLLPAKAGALRRVAFAQLAVPGLEAYQELQKRPEDELGRLTRGLPLWFAETFAASAGYEPVAAIGVLEAGHYALLPIEWTADNVRQLAETNEQPIHYIVTGALRNRHADFELVLRIWEVKKFRELKAFTTRWTPASADTALRQFHEQLRAYMEWTPLPAGPGLPYAAPAAPHAYVHALGASLTLFLGEKGVLQPGQVTADAAPFLAAAQANPDDARAQLALVSALLRLRTAGRSPDAAALEHARSWLGSPGGEAAGVAGLAAKL